MAGIRIGVCLFKPLADVWRDITPYRRERPAVLELDIPGELVRKAELIDQRQRCQTKTTSALLWRATVVCRFPFSMLSRDHLSISIKIPYFQQTKTAICCRAHQAHAAQW